MCTARSQVARLKMMMAASTFIMIKAKVLTTKAKSATKSKTKIVTTKIQATATMASTVMNVPKMLKVMNMKKATGIPSTLGALITMVCKTWTSVKTVHRLSMLNMLMMLKITIHTTSKIRSAKRKKLNCHCGRDLTVKAVEIQVMAVHFLQVMAAAIAMAVQVTSVVIVITGLLSKQMLMMIMDMTAVIMAVAITDDRQDGLR
jgi:hypothetical protein